VEHMIIFLESWWLMGGGRERMRENNGRGWTDESKVYS
jgi:hypothetical protein